MPVLASLLVSAVSISASATPPATLHFVAKGQPLAGISYGIDLVDAQRSTFDQRLSTRVSAGLRTVWYSCPGQSPMTGGSAISFEFEAGVNYELQCRAGQDAVIRRAEDC